MNNTFHIKVFIAATDSSKHSDHKPESNHYLNFYVLIVFFCFNCKIVINVGELLKCYSMQTFEHWHIVNKLDVGFTESDCV